MRAIRVHLGALLLTLAACGPRLPSAVSGPQGDAEAQGVWDVEMRQTDADGDERVEQQEWQVRRRGDAFDGFWDRALTWISGDGRSFACSGRPRYTQWSRHLFSGQRVGGEVRLRITSTVRETSPCSGPDLAPRACVLRRRGARLEALCDGGPPLTLAHRLAPPVPLELVRRAPGSITGVWTWHQRSTDREGDAKLEEEVWQLQQRSGVVEGFYVRTVWVRSGDGRRFQCNNQLQYSSKARFRVRGEIEGNRLRIRELGYTTLPDRCEDGRRTLDAYDGWIQTGGKVIELSWGKGAQLLYRRY
jgi:hypothetical protein